jgi:thioredoxin reductase
MPEKNVIIGAGMTSLSTGAYAEMNGAKIICRQDKKEFMIQIPGD